jgi:hypothetical protein
MNDYVYISLKTNPFFKQLGVPKFYIFYLEEIITDRKGLLVRFLKNINCINKPHSKSVDLETEGRDCTFHEIQEIKEIVTLLSDYFFNTHVPFSKEYILRQDIP